MIEMNAAGAATCIVGGALMVAGTIYPMGFNTPLTREERLHQTTFAEWKAVARQHLQMIAPWNIIDNFRRGWEGIGTTLISLLASLCTFSWVTTGTVLFCWGALWALS